LCETRGQSADFGVEKNVLHLPVVDAMTQTINILARFFLITSVLSLKFHPEITKSEPRSLLTLHKLLVNILTAWFSSQISRYIHSEPTEMSLVITTINIDLHSHQGLVFVIEADYVFCEVLT
jgi:hypothetical protein